MTPRAAMTLREAAERLGVHYMTAYRYVRTGRLPATRDGVEWRVDPADVEHLLDDGTRGSAPDARTGRRATVGRAGRLERRVLAGDVPGAWAVIEEALTSGTTPADVHLDLVLPALQAIGEGWAAGTIGVDDEHRATVAIERVLGQLGPHFAHRGRTRGTVVIGAVAGDRHALPSAILGDLLRDRRLGVVDLGADNPPESFVHAAEKASRLRAVCVAMTTPGLDEALGATTSALAVAGLHVPIVVGGAAIEGEDHVRRVGGDVWSGPDARHAVEVIDTLVEQGATV